jgi:hypothetical protein
MRGEGFIEPAAGRYQIYWGDYATVFTGGQQFFARPGESVEERPVIGAGSRTDSFFDPLQSAYLELLESIRSAVTVQVTGEDVVRGTPCQVVTVETESHEFTVWVDEVYIRRIYEERVESTMWGKHRLQATLELWDFGVSTDTLDWTKFPDFR